MKLLNKDLYLTVNSKNYGKIHVYINDSENKYGDGYFVTATKNKKKLSAFIDKDGNEIIPFEEMELEEIFNSNKYNDICFGFKIPNSDNIMYYHVQKQEDDTYKIIFKTNPYEENPLIIRKVEESDTVWMFETINKYPQYALYSVANKKLITSFCDEISFDIENNSYGHFAYFCMYIYSDTLTEDEEKVFHTSICGFLNNNGNFSSQVLETEGESLYNSYYVGENTFSDDFKTFINCLKITYDKKYKYKEELTNNTLTYLFNNYNLSVKPTEYKKKGKIISFKKEDK